MANIDRLRVSWSGTGIVGPGLSTFYTSAGSMDTNAFHTYFTALAGLWAVTVTVTVPSAGDVIDETTGQITGAWSGAVTAPVPSGATTAPFAQGVGMRQVWETGAVNNGRHVRGATFVVPLHIGCYDTSGTLVASIVNAAQTAGTNLINALGGAMVVYSRPRVGRFGFSSQVTAAATPDRVTTLRSRRT